MNGSESVPEGVRIPRHPSSAMQEAWDEAEQLEAAARGYVVLGDHPDHAINDEQDEYADHRRLQGLINRLNGHGIHATERHQGVLLTEDAARAVLDRLEGK